MEKIYRDERNVRDFILDNVYKHFKSQKRKEESHVTDFFCRSQNGTSAWTREEFLTTLKVR